MSLLRRVLLTALILVLILLVSFATALLWVVITVTGGWW